MVAIVMSALLCLSAWPLGDSYNSPDLPWLLMALALSYLIYPFAMVQVYRVQRSNDLRFLGVMNGGVVSMDNLLCAALAVAGCGVWSVVIPKLIVAPLWVIGFRWYAAKQRLIDTGGKGWGIATKVSRVAFSDYLPVLTFSRFVMGAELIKALRNNLDIFIVGKALGLEALGLYAFAKNAGLGISMTLGSAFSTAFYTHICKIRNLKLSARAGHDAGSFDLAHAFRDVLLLCLCVLSPVILLQALLAPYYIPLLFGGRWDGAVLLVTVLCLSAIPRVFADMYLLRVRASGQTRLEFRVSGLAFAVFSALVLVAADQDVMAVCLAMVLSQLIHWLLAIALTDGVNKAS
jgi:PST family polysaccharide transporter